MDSASRICICNPVLVLFIDQYLTANNELQTSLSISDERNMAWAGRSDAKELRKALNQYLNQQYHTHNVAPTYIDDLSEIKPPPHFMMMRAMSLLGGLH